MPQKSIEDLINAFLECSSRSDICSASSHAASTICNVSISRVINQLGSRAPDIFIPVAHEFLSKRSDKLSESAKAFVFNSIGQILQLSNIELSSISVDHNEKKRGHQEGFVEHNQDEESCQARRFYFLDDQLNKRTALLVINLATQELALAKDNEDNPVANATRDLLVILARSNRFCGSVMDALLQKFHPSTIPHKFILLTLAAIAETNTRGFVPFLNDVLSRINALFGSSSSLKGGDPVKCLFAQVLYSFAESINELSLIQLGETTNARESEIVDEFDPTVVSIASIEDVRKNYADQFETAYEAVSSWSLSKDPKTRANSLKCLGVLCKIIPAMRLVADVRKVTIDLFLNQYKRCSSSAYDERLAIASGLVKFLEACCSCSPCTLVFLPDIQTGSSLMIADGGSSPLYDQSFEKQQETSSKNPFDDDNTFSTSSAAFEDPHNFQQKLHSVIEPHLDELWNAVFSIICTMADQQYTGQLLMQNEYQQSGPSISATSGGPKSPSSPTREAGVDGEQQLVMLKLRNQVYACFRACSERFADKEVYYLLNKLKSSKEPVKLGAIDCLRQLFNSSATSMEGSRPLVTLGLKPYLEDDQAPIRVKIALCQLCISLADNKLLHIESSQSVINFLLHNILLRPDQIVSASTSKKSSQQQQMTEIAQFSNFQTQCGRALYRITKSVHQPGAKSFLWRRLFELALLGSSTGSSPTTISGSLSTQSPHPTALGYLFKFIRLLLSNSHTPNSERCQTSPTTRPDQEKVTYSPSNNAESLSAISPPPSVDRFSVMARLIASINPVHSSLNQLISSKQQRGKQQQKCSLESTSFLPPTSIPQSFHHSFVSSSFFRAREALSLFKKLTPWFSKEKSSGEEEILNDESSYRKHFVHTVSTRIDNLLDILDLNEGMAAKYIAKNARDSRPTSTKTESRTAFTGIGSDDSEYGTTIKRRPDSVEENSLSSSPPAPQFLVDPSSILVHSGDASDEGFVASDLSSINIQTESFITHLLQQLNRRYHNKMAKTNNESGENSATEFGAGDDTDLSTKIITSLCPSAANNTDSALNFGSNALPTGQGFWQRIVLEEFVNWFPPSCLAFYADLKQQNNQEKRMHLLEDPLDDSIGSTTGYQGPSVDPHMKKPHQNDKENEEERWLRPLIQALTDILSSNYLGAVSASTAATTAPFLNSLATQSQTLQIHRDRAFVMRCIGVLLSRCSYRTSHRFIVEQLRNLFQNLTVHLHPVESTGCAQAIAAVLRKRTLGLLQLNMEKTGNNAVGPLFDSSTGIGSLSSNEQTGDTGTSTSITTATIITSAKPPSDSASDASSLSGVDDIGSSADNNNNSTDVGRAVSAGSVVDSEVTDDDDDQQKRFVEMIITELEQLSKLEHLKKAGSTGGGGLMSRIKEVVPYPRSSTGSTNTGPGPWFDTDEGVQQRATIVLTFGHIVDKLGQDQFHLVDQTILPFLRQYIANTKEIAIREAHLETIHLIARYVRDNQPRNYEFQARLECFSYIKQYINESGPLDTVTSGIRVLTAQAIASLVQLKPELAENERDELVSLFVKHLFSVCREKISPKSFMASLITVDSFMGITVDVSASSHTPGLVDSALVHFRTALAHIVQKKPCVDPTLLKLFKCFMQYFGLKTDQERVRAVECALTVLLVYSGCANDCSVGHASDFEPLCSIVGRLGPRLCDSNPTVRLYSAAAIWTAFQLQELHIGHRPSITLLWREGIGGQQEQQFRQKQYSSSKRITWPPTASLCEEQPPSSIPGTGDTDDVSGSPSTNRALLDDVRSFLSAHHIVPPVPTLTPQQSGGASFSTVAGGPVDSVHCRSAINSIAMEVNKRMPRGQLPLYMSALVKMLGDGQPHVVTGAAQLLSSVISIRGKSLGQEAFKVVKILLERLAELNQTNRQAYTELLNGFAKFFGFYPNLVVEILLDQPSPFTETVTEVWSVLARNQEHFDQVLAEYANNARCRLQIADK